MSDRIRLLAAFVLGGLGVWLLLGTALAQDEPEPRPTGRPSSPRALFDEFFRAVNDEVKRAQAGRLDDAAALLDLEGVDGLLGSEPAQGARDLALRLKEVLDLHGRIDLDEIPGDTFGGSIYSLQTDQGPVVTHRLPAGWRFHGDTLRSLDRMLAGFEAAGTRRYELKTLRHLAPKALHGRALFWEHWQWIGLVLLFVACLIVDRILVFVVRHLVSGLLRRRKWVESSAKAGAMASRPVGLLAVALLIWVTHPYLDMPAKAFGVIVKLLVSVAAVLVLYRCADVVAAKMGAVAEGTDSKLDDQLVPLVRKSMKICVCVGGALFILDNLEVDILALVTGLGIFGLGLGLAAKDTAANLFGSFTVFTDRPFQVGDWIVVGGVEGTVEEVGFRSTRVRTFYNSVVSVPNSSVVNTAVDNMGQRVYRRFKTTLGVTYDTPPEKIEAFCAGIRDLIRASDHLRQDYFEVYLNGFGPSSLDILVYTFFKVPDWDAELRERHNFMLEIIRLAQALGVEFAYPSQSLYVESTPERPKPVDERPVDELDAVRKRFARGGPDSRPGGTERWSTVSPE